MNVQKKDRTGMLLIFICFIVYTFAYLGKYSYPTNIVSFTSHYGESKADAGLISTLFFIAYGIGQIVNGILCKFYPKKFIITGALIVSAIINTILFFDIPFYAIKYLWLVNGFAQSVLWPTLVFLLGKHLPKKRLEFVVLAMSFTVAIGTGLSYGLSSLMIHFVNFKYTFLISGIVVFIVAVVWFIFFDKATKQTKLETEEPSAIVTRGKKQGMTTFFLLTLIFLAFFAIACNLVKDGLNTWVPSILKESFYLSDSLSVLLTIILSVLGVFGAFLSTHLYKKTNSFILVAGIEFFMAIAGMVVVILLINTNFWYIVLIVLGLLSLLMHAVCSVVTGMAPLYLRDRLNPGLLSGLMNGACYVGSALSSYGLGSIADNFGWTNVFYILLACCVVPTIICIVMEIVIRKKKIEAIKE